MPPHADAGEVRFQAGARRAPGERQLSSRMRRTAPDPSRTFNRKELVWSGNLQHVGDQEIYLEAVIAKGIRGDTIRVSFSNARAGCSLSFHFAN